MAVGKDRMTRGLCLDFRNMSSDQVLHVLQAGPVHPIDVMHHLAGMTVDGCLTGTLQPLVNQMQMTVQELKPVGQPIQGFSQIS